MERIKQERKEGKRGACRDIHEWKITILDNSIKKNRVFMLKKTRILRIELYRLLESFLVFRILIVSWGWQKGFSFGKIND